jgi:hypothetical protein
MENQIEKEEQNVEILISEDEVKQIRMDMTLFDERITDGKDYSKDPLDKLVSGEVRTIPKNPDAPTSWEKAAMAFEKEIVKLPIEEMRKQKEQLVHSGSNHGGKKYYNYSAKNIILTDKNGEEIRVDMKTEVAGIQNAIRPNNKKQLPVGQVEEASIFDDDDEDHEW